MPHQLADIVTPFSAATSLKPLIVNSLAMMNVANVINARKRKITLHDDEDNLDEKIKIRKIEESRNDEEDFY